MGYVLRRGGYRTSRDYASWSTDTKQGAGDEECQRNCWLISTSVLICLCPIDALKRDMQLLQLLGLNQLPTVFFGHSFGGLIAFELARDLQHNNLLAITDLIISCTNNPQVITERATSLNPSLKKFHKMTNEALFDHIVANGGLQDGLHPDFLRMAIPLIKADYTALETYTYDLGDTGELLQCRVILFGGDADNEVSRDSLFGWRTGFTSNCVETHIFRGNHFYFQSSLSKSDVLSTIKDICLKNSQ